MVENVLFSKGYFFKDEVLIISINPKKENMKKAFLLLLTAASFAACDNSANNATNTKDSLDSIANAKKEMIDSSAEEKKEKIDSTTERLKNTLDRKDSANRTSERDTTGRKAR
jgi:hypothetical protein